MAWFSGRIQWDIAIAPLRDTPFNRCKSDVKFLDYCAIGAAGIYSGVPAYQASVRHLETGWLAENNEAAWVEALEKLLADEPLRQGIAGRASQYLFAERIVARCSHHWLEALDILLNS
jgi:glycosyltransferase involved in cell wall biosynthesis